MLRLFIIAFMLVSTSLNVHAQSQTKKSTDRVDAEHGDIGIDESTQKNTHTDHPDAQWWPDAGLGLFLHWGISSVNGISMSWPMRPGRPLAVGPITDEAEIARIIAEKDYNLTGKQSITPNEYWSAVEDFKADKYDPEKWMKAAAEAGFKYVVLTAKHHEGFAMWPSQFGDFNTRTHMGGRDLIGEYVTAARNHGLKVGLYFSGGDWWAEREYMDYMYYKVPRVNPVFPALDADLNPRPKRDIPDTEIQNFNKRLATFIRGQLLELLTEYGTIDIIWFDGPPHGPTAEEVMTLEEMRALQPSMVVNPRFFGKGDFKTHERHIRISEPETGWAEFCKPWASSWAYTRDPFRANGHIFAEYAKARSLNMNFLLGVGPDASGQLTEASYENMRALTKWHSHHAEAVSGLVTPLPASENASVTATAKGNIRYLFAAPDFGPDGFFPKDLLPPTDKQITLENVEKPTSVVLLRTGESIDFDYQSGRVHVVLPADKRSKDVDVLKVTF